MTQQRVVVVGSGPTGAIAAWQLIRNGVPVTLLEAGTSGPDGLLVRAFGQNLFRKKPPGSFGSDAAEYHRSENTRWFMNLALGGMSNNWTGAVPRFAREDFYDGQRLHEKYVWPLSYDELVPYYEKAERLMGIVASSHSFPTLPAGYADWRMELPPGWDKASRAAAEQGHGLLTLPLADGAPFFARRQGTAFNSYSSIVRGLLSSPLFELVSGAEVQGFEWSENLGTVTAALYRDKSSGAERSCAGAAFVLCAGAIHSARLLLNSKSRRFPTGLGNDRDLVGRYLHDHTREWWAFETNKPLPRLKPSAYMTRGPFEGAPPLMGTSWTLGSTNLKEKLLGLLPSETRSFGCQVFGTMVPTADDRIDLHPAEVAPDGLPKARIQMRFDDDAMTLIENARERLFEILAGAGYQCRLTELEPNQVRPGGAVHYGGSARMHASAEHGVVDAFNRVYGAPNLLVGDAACFTTSPEKNPTLTAMALAARAADQLTADLRRR